MVLTVLAQREKKSIKNIKFNFCKALKPNIMET